MLDLILCLLLMLGLAMLVKEICAGELTLVNFICVVAILFVMSIIGFCSAVYLLHELVLYG